MESQSGGCLPLIYVPYDPATAWHFADRGHALDFACCTGPGRVLDFGPGDGWPSLIIAPRVAEVVGVDASPRRVAECRANAGRMEIANAGFVHVPPGDPLPFADCSFDGAVAASSVEQTPDPAAALREICRVLKPGGRLRLKYESLEQYRGGQEQEVALIPAGAALTHLLIYDRRPDEECAVQYRLSLATGRGAVQAAFARRGIELGRAAAGGQPASAGEVLNLAALEEIAPWVVQAAVCRTSHPTGRTYLRLLEEAGFTAARPTCCGGEFARRLYGQLKPEERPQSWQEADALLEAPVAAAVEQAAPIEGDPPLTAIKGGA